MTHEIVTMVVIDLTLTRFCSDNSSLSTIYSVVIKYLPCSSVWICSQVHRASVARKQHERRPFYTKRKWRTRLVRSWQVAFKSKPIPALPRCPSNKINTYFQSKETPSLWNLTHRFHLWFFLVCSITDYGDCPCVGELSPVTLIAIADLLRHLEHFIVASIIVL